MFKRVILLMAIFLVVPLLLTACYEESGKTFSLETSVKMPSEYDKGLTFEEAMKSNKPIVVKFYVDWCGACKRVAPIFDYVRSQYSDDAEFVMVNADSNPALANSFGIRAFPTIFLVNPSTKVAKEIPYQHIFSEASFLEYLKANSAEFKP